MTVDMSDYDKAVERYEGAMKKSEEIAKKLFAMGLSVEQICAATGLYKKQVLKLQEDDSGES